MVEVLNDKDKILIQENDEEIIIRGIFKNKVIKRKDIRSMYYDNNFYNIYILYENNKFYYRRISNMKLSDKGNLYKIIDDNTNEKILFSEENPIAYFWSIFLVIVLVNYLTSTESGNKIELTLIFISYMIFTVLFINSSKHCSKIYDCENKKFIFYNIFGKIKKEISIDITKMKCNVNKYPINGYFKLEDKSNNIKSLVSSNIEYPLYAKQEVLEVIKQNKGKKEEVRGKREG